MDEILSRSQSFINTIELEVWCKCGKQYTIILSDDGGGTHSAHSCPECGRVVIIQMDIVFDETPRPDLVKVTSDNP